MKEKFFSKLLAVTLAFVMVFTGIGVGQWGPEQALAETVIEVSTQADLAQIANTPGSYKLVADITLDSEWTPIQIQHYDGVTLDGNGYAITLTGSPLFKKIDELSTLKNLVLKGNVSSENSTGSFAEICIGAIRNSISYADVTYSGTGETSWSPEYVAGIAGSMSANSGKISNCVYAGVLTHGNAPLYGGISNFQFFVNGNISNNISIGQDRVGMSEGMSSHSIIAAGSNTLIQNIDDFSPEAYVNALNSNLQEGDLSWSVEDGILALQRGNGGENTPEADASEEEIAALGAAIASAKAVDAEKLYTSDTWSSFSDALTKAENVKAGTSPLKQTAVVNATTALTRAQSSLAEKPTATVSLDGQDAVSITDASGLKNMEAGKYYRLDADITIGDIWLGITQTMNSVLDGNGHTIKLNGAPLWNSIGSDGLIQNLGITGDATYMNSSGALASVCQGLIINCWSQATIKAEGQNGGVRDAGNLIAYLKSGGAIVNCYTVGAVNAGGTTGALVASSEKNTLVQNCYWLNTVNDKAVGSASGNVKNSSAKERTAFYSADFISLLNSQKGENGKTWAVSNTGYPYFGENYAYVPDDEKELPQNQTKIAFAPQGGNSSEITDQKLTVDKNQVNAMKIAGNFQLPDYEVPQGASVKWSCSSQNPEGTGAINEETGEFFVYNTGSLIVTATLDGGEGNTQTLAAVKVEVIQSKVENIKLYLANADGTQETEIEGNAATVQGSETKKIVVKAKYAGEVEYRDISSGSFTFDVVGQTGQVSHMDNSSLFYFTKPGTASVTVTNKTDAKVSASALITSEYVAVKSVKPAISGTIVLHGRNANSTGGEDFLPNYSSVIVSPANASYASSYTIESSDNSVARYVSSMVMGYVPYKAGTITYTASINDNGTVKSGTSEVTYVYLNPLKNVTVKNTAITVKNNQSISAGLVFEGTLTDGHEVTETGMNWSFSQDGIVEITRENGAWKRDESAPDNNMYFLSSEYTIRGLQEGTVIVTGTPADQTGGANPVTFEVTVTAGEAETPADNNKLITEGLNDAKNYYKAQNAEDLCVFGNEWYYFTLTRSGVSIDPENVEKYLNSVKTAYTTGMETDKANKLKPTTLARVILAASSLGEDPENLNGANLIEMLYSSARIVDGGNEAVWALLALDCCNYSIPADAVWTRDKLINEILDYQSEDGGFAWTGKGQNPDIDTTAMAIQALAPYYEGNESVKQAIDSALDYLKSKMNGNCQFGSSEASSQVLIALAALGKDPVSEENGFVKSVARNLISGLDSYRISGKGFKHLLTDSSVNAMATDQALRGLEACRRFYNSENSLYDLTDVNVRKTLEKRVAEANALQEEYYKADLWAAMIDARDKAEAVLANGNASPEELKSADTALSSALAALYQSNPTPGVKAEDIVTYVTIAEEGKLAEGKDSTVMGDVPVTVEDRNSDGKHDVGEVLYAVHERYYEGGAANGFDYMDTWMTKLWGKAASASGIFINDIIGSSGLADYVEEGDYVSVFTYSDKTAYSDKYIAFDKNVYFGSNGETLTINLTGTGYDQSYNVTTVPLSNVKVSILGGNRILGTTDENGALAIPSLAEGTYKLKAYSDDIVTVPAVATIVVKNPSAPQDQVFLRVADPSGRTYLTKTSYDFMAGETAYSILDKSGLEYKSRYYGIYGGYYVYEIEGLAEFDKGSGSGWMYRVNGSYPEFSCSEYKLQAGDYVEWLYTTNLGSDIGAAIPEESKEVTTSGTSGSATTTTPTEVTVSGDTAKATIKTENATEAIKQAKENKSAEIVIEVANSDVKTAEKVQVEIPTATAKEILNTTTADLTVKTPAGTVTIPHDALKEAVAEAKGTTITVEVAAVSKPTDIQKKAAGTNGQIISVTIKSGNTVISTFGGKSLKLKSEVPAKLKGKNIAAIHIAADGTVEKMQGKLINEGTKGYYEFSTPHLSTFALVDADELGLEVNDGEANIEAVKKLVSDMSLKARSSKTSKKNIKVTLTVDKSTAATIKEIKDMGYTVKYKYYRSTKKASKYQARITKTTKSFTNTAGKKGTKYYYKARIQVYDKDGNLVAQTALKQCRYAARTWTK